MKNKSHEKIARDKISGSSSRANARAAEQFLSAARAKSTYHECRRISTSRYLHAKTRSSHARSCGIYEICANSRDANKSNSRASVATRIERGRPLEL